MDDSAITYNVTGPHNEETKTKKVIYKTQNLYSSLAFISITIPLLIAVNIYTYLVKYQTSQKYLWPFYERNDKLK